MLVQTVAALLLCVCATLAQTSEQPVLSDVSRELKGGETHSYRITLTANQFLHAVVIQEGINIVTASFAPDNKQLTESDSPTGDWGLEPVVIVASTAGEYRVEVSAPDPKALPGRYQIKIIALRDASTIDKDHATAQLIFDEARKFRVQQNAAAKRSAIEKYEQALPWFRAAEDTERQALTLYSIGLCYRDLNEPRKALEYFNQALPLMISIGDQRLEASMETNIGGMLHILGDVGQALSHQQRALQVARQIGSRVPEGNALSNIGKIYSDLADWQTALELYAQALAVFRASGLKPNEAITLGNIGVAYYQSGELQKALEYLEQSLPIIRAGGNKNSEAYTLLNIGRVYRRLGDFEKALSYDEQALEIQQQTGNRAGAAETLDEFGLVYSAQGQYEKAFARHRQSLEIQRATGNVRREAVALMSLGEAYRLSGEPEKAVEQYNQALAIFRNIDDLSSAAVTLEGIARAEQKRGQLADARKYIEESLALRETVRSRSGSLQLRASYRATIEKAYEFYIDVLMQQKLDAEALHASERGRARSLLEQLSEARIDIRQGVDSALLEKERDLTRVLNAKAQREMQLKALKGSTAEITRVQGEISTLEDQYQQVQAAIRKSSPQYSALTQPQPLDLKGIQRELDPNTVLLEYSLGEERSYVWVITQNSLTTYALPKREEIENVVRRVNSSLAARTIVTAESPAQRRTRIVSADAEFEKAASELSRMILAPAYAELGKKRLVVVADGALEYVPFAALAVAPNRPLIVDHELVSLPSASAFALQRQILANRPLAPEAVAVIADPVFSTNDDRLSSGARVNEPAATRIIEHGPGGPGGQLSIPRLLFTRWEADQILAVSPAGSTLKAVGFNANRAIAGNGELSKYRYVHFATHGYVDTERSGFSAIVLSMFDKEGKPQDGFLRTHDIYNLKLPAELVVLSACETGLGKEVTGEGLEGLTRAFMYAGARRVVVSLWNVNDKATAALMKHLYTEMLRSNKTPAAALRAAQIEMLRTQKWQSPYFWAPFVMQGEWK
ncbi:MAG TPA: CHAT domain-containing tetratricopeptide repeat protein [Pyrinomonadaceae bacterium]|nr:CHAT domain-containing tetratricopeptide repeat protein [Pyrinomonadaceae bacterium]